VLSRGRTESATVILSSAWRRPSSSPSSLDATTAQLVPACDEGGGARRRRSAMSERCPVLLMPSQHQRERHTLHIQRRVGRTGRFEGCPERSMST
jgi:hypothetical protein